MPSPPGPALSLALLLAAAAPAAAQTAPAPAPPATARPAHPPTIRAELLFVQNARAVATDKAGRTLTLSGIGPTTLFFTDRPVRIAGHFRNAEYLAFWRPDHPDSFARNPPNAVLSVFDPRRDGLADAVVTLSNPRLKGDQLTYDVRVIRGALPRAGGPATLFIDRFAAGFRAADGGYVADRRWGYVGAPVAVDGGSSDPYVPPTYQPPSYQAPDFRPPAYSSDAPAPLPEVIRPGQPQ